MTFNKKYTASELPGESGWYDTDIGSEHWDNDSGSWDRKSPGSTIEYYYAPVPEAVASISWLTEEDIKKEVEDYSPGYDLFVKEDLTLAKEDFRKGMQAAQSTLRTRLVAVDPVGLIRWIEKLPFNQKVTVHPPVGSGAGHGIYPKTAEQLLNDYLTEKNNGK